MSNAAIHRSEKKEKLTRTKYPAAARGWSSLLGAAVGAQPGSMWVESFDEGFLRLCDAAPRSGTRYAGCRDALERPVVALLKRRSQVRNFDHGIQAFIAPPVP
jgi:hypothetical protein